MSDNSKNPIIDDSRAFFAFKGFSEDDSEYYISRLIKLLDDYADHFGEGVEFEYVLFKRFSRLEIRIKIPGERYDPLENGEDSRRS